MAKFSKRSTDELVGVEPALVRVMNAAIIDTPHDFTVVEGLRSANTQIEYYKWGRTKVNPNTGALPGRPFGAIVTKRDGVTKKSEHQAKANGKGKAIDFCPYTPGVGLDWDNTKAFREIAAHIKKKALELKIPISWGGDWKGELVDLPHVELK